MSFGEKIRKASMNRIVGPGILGVAAAAGTEVPARMLENHTIGLPSLCSIVIVVFGAGMWLSRKFNRIEDRLEGLPCQTNGCSLRRRSKRKRNR